MGRITAKVRCGTALEMERQICYNGKNCEKRRSAMKILITGSDPFGGETVNPAYEAVKLLPDTIAGAEIIKLEVPTRFHRAGAVLEDAMQRHKPDAVICVGQCNE